MYRLAICEDNLQEAEHLKNLCSEILSTEKKDFQISCFKNPTELLEEQKEEQAFDVLLLDIELGDQNGMEFAQSLRRQGNRISIIFVTGNEGYLKEGYSVQPIQYLLKPVERESLREALLTDLKLNHTGNSISVHCDRKTVVLPLDEIFYMESSNHKVVVHMKEAYRELSVSMGKMMEMLPADKFCRCHNGFLVNMAHISEIMRTEVLLTNSARVPIGRQYYKEAQKAFIHFLNQTGR